jgi:hypothetical protein
MAARSSTQEEPRRTRPDPGRPGPVAYRLSVALAAVTEAAAILTFTVHDLLRGAPP